MCRPILDMPANPLTYIFAIRNHFPLSHRLKKVKTWLKTYVHKKRFKKVFGNSAAEKRARVAVAKTLKSKAFWKKVKYINRVAAPIMRSMRLCDMRVEGKAGLLVPSLQRMKAAVEPQLTKLMHKFFNIGPALQVEDKTKERLRRSIAFWN